jgi:hypothetical protein
VIGKPMSDSVFPQNIGTARNPRDSDARLSFGGAAATHISRPHQRYNQFMIRSAHAMQLPPLWL